MKSHRTRHSTQVRYAYSDTVNGGRQLIKIFIGKTMKKQVLAIVLCFLFVANFAVGEELNDEKKLAIKELLQVTGAYQLGELFSNTFTQQMVSALKASKPDVDPRAFDIIKEETDGLFHDELVVKESLLPLMYPIYHKYLSLDETIGLIKFYKTPLGRKAISVMPKMTEESMAAGQEWGKIIAPKLQKRVLNRLEKEHINIQ